jgi:hypothetical protein
MEICNARNIVDFRLIWSNTFDHLKEMRDLLFKVCKVCIAIEIRFVKKQFFGASVLWPPMWESGPSFLGGHVGASKLNLPMPLPATN